jgi:hypothetical protein
VGGIILIRTLSKRDYHQNCMSSKASVISGISETKKVKTLTHTERFPLFPTGKDTFDNPSK